MCHKREQVQYLSSVQYGYFHILHGADTKQAPCCTVLWPFNPQIEVLICCLALGNTKVLFKRKRDNNKHYTSDYYTLFWSILHIYSTWTIPLSTIYSNIIMISNSSDAGNWRRIHHPSPHPPGAWCSFDSTLAFSVLLSAAWLHW